MVIQIAQLYVGVFIEAPSQGEIQAVLIQNIFLQAFAEAEKHLVVHGQEQGLVLHRGLVERHGQQEPVPRPLPEPVAVRKFFAGGIQADILQETLLQPVPVVKIKATGALLQNELLPDAVFLKAGRNRLLSVGVGNDPAVTCGHRCPVFQVKIKPDSRQRLLPVGGKIAAPPLIFGVQSDFIAELVVAEVHPPGIKLVHRLSSNIEF